jgi:hypothetical protein
LIVGLVASTTASRSACRCRWWRRPESGVAHPANAGNGFLVDRVSLDSDF